MQKKMKQIWNERNILAPTLVVSAFTGNEK
jgi:hypothetical protein